MRGRKFTKTYWSFVLAQGISFLGDTFFNIAIMWLVYDSTHSLLQSATIGATWHLSYLFLSPFAGVVADKYDRKKILIITNFIDAFVTILIAVYYFNFGKLNLLISVCAVLIVNSTSTFIRPARDTILPDIVDYNELEKAQGIILSSKQGFQLVGTALAGIVISAFGGGAAILIDGLTFIITGVIFMTISFPKKEVDVQVYQLRLIDNIKNGWNVILENKIILILFITSISMNVPFMIGPFYPAIIIANLNGSSFDYSVLSTIGMISAVLIGLKADVFKRYMSNINIIFMSWLFLGISILGISVSTNKLIFIFFVIVTNSAATLSNINFNVLLLKQIPEKFRGRIIGIISGFSVVLIPITTMIAGYFGEFIHVKYIFIFSGIWGIVTSLIFVFAINKHKDDEKKDKSF